MTVQRQRPVAWAAVCVAVLFVLVPLGAYSWHLAQAAQDLRISNAKLELAVSQRAGLETELEQLQTDTQTSSRLVPGVSEAVASAAIQERIRLITEAAGGSLDSARVRPAERLGDFEKISMTVRVTSDSDGLARILSDVEFGSPAITVEKLAIRANRNLRRMSNAPAATAGTDLIATMDLSAWRRP